MPCPGKKDYLGVVKSRLEPVQKILEVVLIEVLFFSIDLPSDAYRMKMRAWALFGGVRASPSSRVACKFLASKWDCVSKDQER